MLSDTERASQSIAYRGYPLAKAMSAGPEAARVGFRTIVRLASSVKAQGCGAPRPVLEMGTEPDHGRAHDLPSLDSGFGWALAACIFQGSKISAEALGPAGRSPLGG